jgi:alpha-1,2-mannosyltransferase
MRRLRWVPIVLGSGTVVIYWVGIIFKPRGDFSNHWEFGRRILAGEYIYSGGLNFVYSPFWALAHAPLALLNPHLAQIVAYVLAPLSLAALLWTLHELSKEHLPLSFDKAFWSTCLATFLAVHFLSRDLPEIGINTALVALSWYAIYLWARKRELAGGMSLGLAAALKPTPLLFIAYFALKRQWKMAATSTAVFALLTVAPIAVQGPDLYIRGMRDWTTGVVRGIMDPDPSRGPLGEEKVENLALRPALARYLMHLPYGHLGRPETSDTPGRPHQPPNLYYLQFVDLPPYYAGIAVRSIMVTLLIVVVWLFRKKVSARTDPAILFECAAVSLLILLYSPITWKQHCVGVLPALFLICRSGFAGRPIPRWALGAVAVYALFALVLSREIIGQDLVKLLDSYRVKTIAIVLLMSALLGCRQALLATEVAEKDFVEDHRRKVSLS